MGEQSGDVIHKTKGQYMKEQSVRQQYQEEAGRRIVWARCRIEEPAVKVSQRTLKHNCVLSWALFEIVIKLMKAFC